MCRREPGKGGGWGEWKWRNRHTDESTVSCDADDGPMSGFLGLAGDTQKCKPADIREEQGRPEAEGEATVRDRAQEADRGSQAKDCQPDSKSHGESLISFKQGHVMISFRWL